MSNDDELLNYNVDEITPCTYKEIKMFGRWAFLVLIRLKLYYTGKLHNFMHMHVYSID